MSFVPAPLHSIHVQSKLASGFFPFAVRACFPVDGVDFIMGKDIAGGKVYPDLEVVDTPISESETDELVQKHPEVFSVSVLTRAQVVSRPKGWISRIHFSPLCLGRTSCPLVGKQRTVSRRVL